jgi:phosphate-selective porin O/P/haloacid dehalogenase-like hydrolase
MEEKLDRLQKQTAANTATAAEAKAKADVAKEKADRAKADIVASANAAIPLKGPIPHPDAAVHMTNNRPTICTADERNCVSITSRVHFDGGGYDYHPNSPFTNPQKLDNGVNVRRARIGVLGKFFEDWNYALIYDFGATSDSFGGTGAVGPAPGTPVGFLPGGATSALPGWDRGVCLIAPYRSIKCRPVPYESEDEARLDPPWSIAPTVSICSLARMDSRLPNTDLIIFDCDGVLVDSEVLSCRCLARVLHERGVELSIEQVLRLFLGRSTADVIAYCRAAGNPLRNDFLTDLSLRIRETFRCQLESIAGWRRYCRS